MSGWQMGIQNNKANAQPDYNHKAHRMLHMASYAWQAALSAQIRLFLLSERPPEGHGDFRKVFGWADYVAKIVTHLSQTLS